VQQQSGKSKQDCPVSSLSRIIGGKWTIEIMRELAIQPTRTRKFLMHIPGLSMKSLRERLHEMEQANLIVRKEYEGRPLKVEYSITDRGRRLFAILEQIKELSETDGERRCVCSVEEECLKGEATVMCPSRREETRRRGSTS
jgi:DNA-binding HxlR family transcriptional regulator